MWSEYLIHQYPSPNEESIIIFCMNTKDLTPESAWLTLRIGELINVKAVIYPMSILNPIQGLNSSVAI